MKRVRFVVYFVCLVIWALVISRMMAFYYRKLIVI